MACINGPNLLRGPPLANHGPLSQHGPGKGNEVPPECCALTPRYQRLIGPYWSLLHIIMSQWTNGDWRNQQALRQGFLDHYKHVRAVVPEERLLEFRSEDGWEPLCRFLDERVPENSPYPHVNDGDGVVRLHEFLYWIRLVKALARYLGPVVVVALGVWVFRNAR